MNASPQLQYTWNKHATDIAWNLARPSHPEQDFESASLVQRIHNAISGLCECNTNVPEQASEAGIG